MQSRQHIWSHLPYLISTVAAASHALPIVSQVVERAAAACEYTLDRFVLPSIWSGQAAHSAGHANGIQFTTGEGHEQLLLHRVYYSIGAGPCCPEGELEPSVVVRDPA